MDTIRDGILNALGELLLGCLRNCKPCQLWKTRSLLIDSNIPTDPCWVSLACDLSVPSGILLVMVDDRNLVFCGILVRNVLSEYI